MIANKAYCDNHEYEWAPYALAYINYWMVDEDGAVVYEKQTDSNGDVIFDSSGDPVLKKDGQGEIIPIIDESRLIYEDWPEDYGWGPNARADVWGTDFFSEEKDAVNFLATPGQMHIHTPSEHQFDGKNYDAEIHWVHYTMVDGAPNFSVIGFMFDIDDGDAAGNDTLIEELLETYNLQSPD